MSESPAACSAPSPPARRVAVVSPIFGGSYPIATASAQALAALDHQVTLLDMRGFAPLYLQARKAGTQRAQQAFFGAVRDHLEARLAACGPELVLALAQAPVRPDLLESLRAGGVVSALWFVEHFQRFTAWRTLAPHYDWLFTIQQAPFTEALVAAGVRHQAYLPLAAAPSAAIPHANDNACEYRSALAFFGSPYPNRIALFSTLADQGLGLWGRGWSRVTGPLAKCVRSGDRTLDPEMALRVYAGADIVLNLHSSTTHETVRDFVNPRTFQVAGAGCFQLVDRRSLLPLHFSDEELVCFDSAADLRNKVHYYLAHADARRAMAAAARQRVLAEHTYTRRMASLIAYTLGSRPPEVGMR